MRFGSREWMWASIAGWAVAVVLLAVLILSGGASDEPASGAAEEDEEDRSALAQAEGGEPQPVSGVSGGIEWDFPFPPNVFPEDPRELIDGGPPAGSQGNPPSESPEDGGRAAQPGMEGADPAPAVVPVEPNPPDTMGEGSTGDEGSGVEAPEAGDGWGAILPAETLESEIRRLINQMQPGFANPNAFNLRDATTQVPNYEMVKQDAAVIAVLARIAEEHPDPEREISWRNLAPQVAQRASQVVANARSTSFEPANRSYEVLQDLLLNNSGADSTPPVERMPFSNLVPDRSLLMLRMQRADTFFRDNITSQATLEQNAEEAVHEARILAALSAAVGYLDADGAPDYEFADDEEYQQHTRAITAQSVAMAEAAAQADYERFAELLSANQASCNACHAAYRFADDGF